MYKDVWHQYFRILILFLVFTMSFPDRSVLSRTEFQFDPAELYMMHFDLSCLLVCRFPFTNAGNEKFALSSSKAGNPS